MNQIIAIASDHGGYDLKDKIKQKFAAYEWLDLGADSSESVDYPAFGAAMGEAITTGKVPRGIIICGSGIGISIAANRFPAVRAALCTSTEMAALARQHNDANVLALGARLMSEEQAYELIETFLKTEFEGGRHERRVNQLNDIT